MEFVRLFNRIDYTIIQYYDSEINRVNLVFIFGGGVCGGPFISWNCGVTTCARQCNWINWKLLIKYRLRCESANTISEPRANTVSRVCVREWVQPIRDNRTQQQRAHLPSSSSSSSLLSVNSTRRTQPQNTLNGVWRMEQWPRLTFKFNLSLRTCEVIANPIIAQIICANLFIECKYTAQFMHTQAPSWLVDATLLLYTRLTTSLNFHSQNKFSFFFSFFAFLLLLSCLLLRCAGLSWCGTIELS